MTSLRSLLLALLIAAPLAAPLAAQGAPAPLVPASPPPPTPAAAAKPVAPPANAVALCNDQTFVVAPAKPETCAARGGVKLLLPGFRATPAPAAVAPSVRAAALQAAPSAPSARNDAPPAGATMRCRDGSWLSGTPQASRCDRNGGLAVILPAPPAAPVRTP